MVQFPSKHKDNSERSTGLLFMRTYNKWHGEVKRQLKKLGLTHPQFVILTALGYSMQYESEVTQVMLAKIAGMDVMSVSQIINLLDKNSLISRKEHSKDTRAKSVTLTEKGQNILNEALPIVENIDAQFFGSLEKEEKVFISLLHRLNEFDYEL
nr:MarR family transcriptional regulator [Clostridioides difficile]